MFLAEFNIGTLKHDWDDPRVADVRDNLDRVDQIATRSKGYVWHLNGDAMETAKPEADGVLGGTPRTASPLSVREIAQSLEAFAFNWRHLASVPLWAARNCEDAA